MSGRLEPEALRLLTLGRQMLLRRSDVTALEAVRRLAGLNAQHRRAPYIGLWSRLEGFQRQDLEQALGQGLVQKATLMRGTLHLVPADEHPLYFAGLAEARRRSFRSFFPRVAASIPEDRVQDILREVLGTAPRPFRELERLLQPFFPQAPAQSLSFAAKALAPLVQLPPAGAWDGRGSPVYAWAGSLAAVPAAQAEEALLERYLGAFGPATIRDFAQWSGLGLTTAQAVRNRLGDRLREFPGDGGPYLDLATASREVQAEPPVRLLPRWDNLLLAYRDRSRVLPPNLQEQVIMRDGRVLPTFLVGGQVAGTWDIGETGGQGTILLSPLRRLSQRDQDALREEADALGRWLAPGGGPGHAGA